MTQEYLFRVSLLEEYKDNINIFTKQIADKKTIIQQLEQTKKVNDSLTQDEQKTLEKRLFNLKQKLENEREKLKSIDKILSAKPAPSAESSNQNGTTSKLSAFEDSSFDRNCNLMSKSFNENMFFNRNKIEVSHFDFSLDGDAKEEEKVLNNVVTVMEPRNSTPKIISRNTSVDTDCSDNASPLMMPKYHSLSSINLPQDGMVPYPKSNKSNGAASSGGASVVPRQIPKHKRPLTRYLPNFSLDFNLRHHIETAGHQIQLCPHVFIDGNCLHLIIAFNLHNLTFVCFFLSVQQQAAEDI